MGKSSIATALENSAVVGWVRAPLSGIGRWYDRLRRWVHGSLLRDIGYRVGERLRPAGRSTRSGAALRAGTDVLRGSALYRWFTAEPEPDVIVIDLRDTVTVGPVLGALDRLVQRGVAATPTSRVTTGVSAGIALVHAAPVRIAGIVSGIAVATAVTGAAVSGTLTTTALGAAVVLFGISILATRVRLSWRSIRKSRAMRALIRAFEPPAPPTNRTDGPASDPAARSEARVDDESHKSCGR